MEGLFPLARAFQFFMLFLEGAAKAVLDCAHPTRGVRDRALREHRRSSGSIPSSVLRARRTPGRSLPIPSQGARSGSTGPTWVPFPPSYSCAFREQEDGQTTLPILSSPPVT